ncbi:MAG: ferredoxin family protein [Pseudomonadales bacterium]|nr:ferredoxin family protein [Pseudomonadales bacterium]MCP5189108.1 ferredoxin family protein [Pseudomonadales bacterium]
MKDANCKHQPGQFVPVVNRNRCEGKSPCVDACPYDVFVIATLPQDKRKELSLIGKIKGFRHQWQQAFAVNSDSCHGCGSCVTACPEKAITLSRSS